jgi:hypothetical protein
MRAKKKNEYYCPITGPNANADLFFTDDADRPNVQYLNIFYEDRMFRDFEIILTINLN